MKGGNPLKKKGGKMSAPSSNYRRRISPAIEGKMSRVTAANRVPCSPERRAEVIPRLSREKDTEHWGGCNFIQRKPGRNRKMQVESPYSSRVSLH